MSYLKEEAERRARAIELSKDIRRKFLVLSGKGGVGKSLVSAYLSIAFSMIGFFGRVGLLDVDIHGGSVPIYFGLISEKATVENNRIRPIETPVGVRVFSISLLLEREDIPIIWRGPLKAKFIEQSLADVDWRGTDILVIDTPPGTGDETMSVVRAINKIDGAILVTVPSELTVYELRKAAGFLKNLKVRALGVVENMSYLECEGDKTKIFGHPIDDYARETGLEILARIPIEPSVSEPPRDKIPYIYKNPGSPISQEFLKLARRVLELSEY